MKPKTCKTCASKRRYSSNEETASSNEEDVRVTNMPIEKKSRERTTPPTTDNERVNTKRTKEKSDSASGVAKKPVSASEIDEIVFDTVGVSLRPRQDSTNKSVEIFIEKPTQTPTGKDNDDFDSKRKNDAPGSLKDGIKEIEQLWATIEGKRNVYVGNKGPRDSFLYDFLGEEVDRDEAEALEALNFYWLNTVAKSAAKPRTDIPEEHKDFYNKYCNGTRDLTVESAMKLMSLPHVVTVNLMSNAKIEVVVSDVFLALQDSPELRHDDFEVVEAMGMHLF